MKFTLPLLLIATLAFVTTTIAETPVEKKPVATETKAANEPKNVTPDEAEKLIKEKKAVILDIRTPAEFEREHIAGAINVNFMDEKFPQEIEKLDKNTPLIIYCGSGGRSTRSLPQFKEKHFLQIYHLKDGVVGWVQAGKPLTK